MAGTDATRPGVAGGPAVVLVETQLAENIGMAARAMLNCGLTDLRLVRPRPAWPNDKARAASAGADAVIETARVFETTAEAIADLDLVLAATARPRDMVKRVATPERAAAEMRARHAAGGRAGLLFGKEAWGLDNDDVALADAIVQVPLNPAYSSLNVAMAVLVVGYEWFKAADATPAEQTPVPKDTRPATKAEMQGLFDHLETELDACGFLRVTEKRPIMVRNLRTMLARAGLTEQEVRTLRGVVSGLVSGPKRGSDGRGGRDRCDLHHAHVFCADIEATIAWWTAMLDAEVAVDETLAGARNVFLKVGSGRLHLYDQPPRESGRNAVHHLGVRVGDLRARVAAMRAKGHAFRTDIREFGTWRYVMTAAPDDVLLELFEFDADALEGDLRAYFAER